MKGKKAALFPFIGLERRASRAYSPLTKYCQGGHMSATGVKTTAFVLLIALIIYVAVLGAA